MQWTMDIEPFTIKMPEKEGETIISDKNNWQGDGILVTPTSPELKATLAGQQWIEGKIENGKFLFLYHFNYNVCHGFWGGDYVMSGDYADTNWATIEIKNNAHAREDFSSMGVTSFIDWTLTVSCTDKMPSLKSQMESLLDASIAANESPAQAHEKLMALSNQNFPVGKIYKVGNDCMQVKGASIDLQYKVGQDEDSIFKTVGSTDGQDHQIIRAVIDIIVNRGGTETQIYYAATIDVSLKPI
jgi:hypothetical protein